jgi:transcriptional regulator with XRE-family HTH domain
MMYVDLDDDIFSANLRYLRKKHKLTQKALSKLVGIGVHRLRGIEHHILRANITPAVLERLCDVLDTSAQALTADHLDRDGR